MHQAFRGIATIGCARRSHRDQDAACRCQCELYLDQRFPITAPALYAASSTFATNDPAHGRSLDQKTHPRLDPQKYGEHLPYPEPPLSYPKRRAIPAQRRNLGESAQQGNRQRQPHKRPMRSIRLQCAKVCEKRLPSLTYLFALTPLHQVSYRDTSMKPRI